MAIDLDLTPSRAKLSRAREHLLALERELRRVNDGDAVAIWVSEVNPDTGWCRVLGRLNEIDEPLQSVIAGEYVHDLRSALDYLVTALVLASKVSLRGDHGFPIFTNRQRYRREVGTAQRTVKGGPLHGVTCGLQLIEGVQPYRKKPDPHRDPLALLNRLSNTDKHQQLVKVLGFPAESWKPSMKVYVDPVSVIEQEQRPRFELSLDEDTELAALRLKPPYPPDVHVDPELEVEVMLGVPPSPPRWKRGVMLSFPAFAGIADRVEQVLSEADRP